MRSPSKIRRAMIVASVVGLTSTATWSEPARAAQASASPRFDATGVDGCPDAAEFRRAVAGHLGRDPFDEDATPRVAVRVREDADKLVADVAVGTSSRTLEGDTCADLVRAAALTVALAIERDPRRETPPPPPPSPPRVAPPAPPPASFEPTTPGGSAPISRDRAVVTASGATALGLLPSPSPGVGLAARARVSESIWASARGVFFPRAPMPDDLFAMSLVAGGAGACVEPFATRGVAAVGCAHLLVGSLATTSSNVMMREGGAKPWVAAALAAGARARVAGPLVLEGSVEADLPLSQPTFVAETCPPAGFRQPFAALVVALGVGVSIP
ncbi:MAG: hypothetical protein KF819_02065 [Labilithrix sp.]|nr:hypothetical protein [Labilithrix sp.]